MQNRCRVTDLLNSSATRWSANEDCVFHHGLACCESCDLNDVIAISKYGDFSALTCTGAEECAQCEPPPVEHTSLFCSDGHCRATPWLTP